MSICDICNGSTDGIDSMGACSGNSWAAVSVVALVSAVVSALICSIGPFASWRY
jgi:hypothetical protein